MSLELAVGKVVVLCVEAYIGFLLVAGSVVAVVKFCESAGRMIELRLRRGAGERGDAP